MPPRCKPLTSKASLSRDTPLMPGDYVSKEIEITPEMRLAGAAVIQELSGVVDSEFLAGRVYTAMAYE